MLDFDKDMMQDTGRCLDGVLGLGLGLWAVGCACGLWADGCRLLAMGCWLKEVGGGK